MANPLHIDSDCSGDQLTVRPLSDQEYSDHQAFQAAIAAQLQAEETAAANRRTAVRTLLQTHPELQVLVDFLGLQIT